ncbi:MAG: RNA polymerase sigma factor [Deltaproteobacteria bacterium]|nr:RNA polymerase sigma factor [Deltaproteobacteria bacterium]
MGVESTARQAGSDPVIDAIQRGDPRGALGLCARLHGPAIGRLCMSWLGSQAEAEEAAQETLLAALDALGQFRGDGTVRAWLFGIARRVCARRVETRGRREARLRLVHADADSPDAAALLATRRRAERVRLALEQLKPSERDAVVLRYEGELSFREVADACGIDEAAARKRVSRALERLRQDLGQEL